MKNKGVLVVAKEKGKGGTVRQLALAALCQVAVAAASALLAQVSLFGGLHPFGLALMIGVPDVYSVAALMGFVSSGLLFRVTVNTTAYTAAAGVVAALRWILAGMTRGRRQRGTIYPACARGCCPRG